MQKEEGSTGKSKVIGAVVEVIVDHGLTGQQRQLDL